MCATMTSLCRSIHGQISESPQDDLLKVLIRPGHPGVQQLDFVLVILKRFRLSSKSCREIN